MIRSVDLTPPPEIRSKLDEAYNHVMSSGNYIGGYEVEFFENKWGAYNDSLYCIAVGNGMDALQLILRAIRMTSTWGGNRVFVPEWTATPTWSAVSAIGATPTPMRVGENIKMAFDKKIFSPAIFVNLYGSLCEINSKKFRHTIEDCAQSHGLKPRTTAAWSFYPTKNLGAYGDAGAVTTDNYELYKCIIDLHNYGCEHAINSRMDPLQARFLRVKLPYLDMWNEQRHTQAATYTLNLECLDIILPDMSIPSVFHQYVIRTKAEQERLLLREYLLDRGVETQIHYTQTPSMKLFGTPASPEVENLSHTCLSLPIGPHLTTGDTHTVSELIKNFYISYGE